MNLFWVLVPLIALFMLLLSTAPSTAQEMSQRPRAVDREGHRAEPSIAIVDVCAWPNLLLLPDGTLVMLIFNQPSHGRMIGDIECWASTDRGQTWSRRGVAAPDDPGSTTARMNHAAGFARNGDLVVVTGGWTLLPDPKNADAFTFGDVLRPCVSRSKDSGFTWTVDHDAFPTTGPGNTTFVPYGSILPGRDGALRLSAYTFAEGYKHAYVLRSEDDGGTWGDPRKIESELTLNETFLWHDGSGRWLAASRGGQLELFESADDARTWRHLGTPTRRFEFPGHLLRLADGRMLLSHGTRVEGRQGVDLRVSVDDGRTWSPPTRLAGFIGNDGGYPSSVQLADGSIVTVFYARATAQHDGYHVGVVSWDPTATLSTPDR